MSQADTLRIDIVSDVVCPWCIIGYKQLQKALTAEDAPRVEIVWHPFELNPHMPPGGQNLREHMMEKYGSTPEQSQAARQRLTALGESLGFTFNYRDDSRMVNTFAAHQLLHWAGEQGRQTDLKLALFDAYFTRGEAIDQSSVLVQVAKRAGFDPADAEAVLSDGRYADTVRAEQRTWLERGIQAVPTFVFNNQYQVAGAQEAATFTRVFSALKTAVKDG